MTTLTMWEPTRDLAFLRDEIPRTVLRLLSRDGTTPVDVGAFAPALDLEETPEGEWRLYVDLPGVSLDDITISFEAGMLTIAGERSFYADTDPARFRRVERHFGRFHRAVRLPEGVDPDGIEAHYRDGILEIVVPRDERARPRKVVVENVG